MAWLGQLQNRCSGFARFHNSNTHIRGVADTNHLSHPRLAVRLGSQPTQAGNPGTNSTYRYMGGRLSPQAQRGGRCRFIGTQCHAGRPCWPRPSSTRRLNSRFPSPDPRCCTRTYSVHRGFSRRFGHPALPRCGSLPYRVAETSLSYAFPLISIREHPMSAALVGSEPLWGPGYHIHGSSRGWAAPFWPGTRPSGLPPFPIIRPASCPILKQTRCASPQ